MSTIHRIIAMYEERVARLTRCITALREVAAAEMRNGEGPAVSRETEELPARAVKRGRVKAPSHQPTAGRRREGLRQHIEAWFAGRSEPFTAEDLPEQLRAERQKVAQALWLCAKAGTLKRVGYGRYVLAGAAPTTPVVNRLAPGSPALEGKTLKERVAQAAGYIIGLHEKKSLSARALIDEARGVFPALVENDNRIQDFRVALIDAAAAGLLVRIGKGPDAVYTTPP